MTRPVSCLVGVRWLRRDLGSTSVAENSPSRTTPDRHPGHTGTNPREEEVSAVPTYTPKAGDTTRSWYVIDATDVVLGRLAVEAAKLLRGKHKPTFTPNVDGGDFVIVINAEKVAISGDKLKKKFAYRHSGFPGGLRARALGDELEKHADTRRREGDRRHAPAQQAEPSGPEEAEGLCRARSIRTPRSSRFRSRSSRWPSDRTDRRDRSDRGRAEVTETEAPEVAETAERRRGPEVPRPQRPTRPPPASPS